MAVRKIVFGVLSLLTVQLYGQTYKNLVFEGAGIRGLAYAGALEELQANNKLTDIEKVGGTSAGAIAALTVALRYSPQEIQKIILDTKIQKFNDGKFFFIGGIARINKGYGWYRGKAFTKWLEKIIADKTGNKDITFQELHLQGFRDLYVTGTSLNRQQLIIFSRENYPHMRVKDAVRISMSIPLYFEAVCIDSSGHVLNRKHATGEYDIMVDGGFTGNFPIFLFDSLYHSGRRYNPHTLGLRIDSDGQIAYDINRAGLAPVDILNFKNYLRAFYVFVVENLNRQYLTEEDWQRTVSISSGNIGPKIRKLSKEEKELLISNGREAIQRFLATTK
jgi:NTE family protein